MSITSTAVNRQILALEQELGQPIFERLPRGVRLNIAGQMFLIYARQQMRDFERMKIQLADLSEVRRGHMTIASTQAAIPYFLPRQITEYLDLHPGVTFKMNPCDIETAQEQLTSLEADLAIVFEPLKRNDFQIIESIQQEIVAIFDANHALAQNAGPVRLSECLQHPLALPADVTGVRNLLEIALQRRNQSIDVSLECEDSHLLLNASRLGNLVTFDIPPGLSQQFLKDNGLDWRPVDQRDIPRGSLCMGQIKDRSLSVAASGFAVQIVSALQDQTTLCD